MLRTVTGGGALNDLYTQLQFLIKKYDIQLDSSTTTSFHSINGDNLHLTSSEKMLYMLLNHINNNAILTPMETINFTLDESMLQESWEKLKGTPSPVRAVGDMFWMNLPWEEIQDTLGEIHVADIGCGNGNYCKKLFLWSHNLLSSYTGFDIFKQPTWDENTIWGNQHNFKIDYQQIDIDKEVENINFVIPENTNFIMSQSSLEHMQNDLEFFRQIKKRLLTRDTPCFQYHLFPAPASLNLYLLHGYRQYGLLALSKIIALFEDWCSIEIFKICGEASHDLHFEYITKPIYIDKNGDRRESEPAEYRKLLYAAIRTDMHSENTNPGFWALKISYLGKNDHK